MGLPCRLTPVAFPGSKPLAQWREAGRWPPCYDEPRARLLARHGKQNDTRATVPVVKLGRVFGHDALRAAISTAVSLGACGVAAVPYLLTETALQKGKPPPIRVRVRTGDGEQNGARPVMRLDSLVCVSTLKWEPPRTRTKTLSDR